MWEEAGRRLHGVWTVEAPKRERELMHAGIEGRRRLVERGGRAGMGRSQIFGCMLFWA